MKQIILVLCALISLGGLTVGCGPSSDPVDPAIANSSAESGKPESGGAAVQQTVD